LLDAEFAYNVPEWRPKVNYTVNGNQGTLIAKRPDTDFFVTDDVRYEWDLTFNDKAPLDLYVETGSADARLDLAGLSLTRLGIHTSSGDLTFDLSGSWARDLDVTIDSAAGRVTAAGLAARSCSTYDRISG